MNKLSEKAGTLKILYRNNLWRGRLILAAVIILLVLVVVRVSLPFTIVHSTMYWLNKQGVASQIEDITINVIKGTFTVIGASGSKHGTTVFNIGKASIDWEWRPLARKTIHIKRVGLEDFDLAAEQYKDAIVIAGIVIKEGETVEQQPVEQDSPVAWGTSLNQIEFMDLGFCFEQFTTTLDAGDQGKKNIDYCGTIELLSWQGDFDLGNTDPAKQPSEQTLSADGTLHIKSLQLFNNTLDNALINIGGTSLSNIKINGINDIKLDAIKIDQFALLQRSGHASHKHAVEFSNLEMNNISFDDTNTVAINTIVLNGPVLSMARDETGKYKYEPWLLQSEPEPVPPNTTQQPAALTENDTPFNIKLGNIRITDSELCYEQKAAGKEVNIQALDYCLNLARSEWSGDIAITTPVGTTPLLLTLSGDLSLSSFITTNNLLNRDLLAFETLVINNININGLDDLAFGKLNLSNTSGLELVSTEDKHTMTVARIDISDFSYRSNALSIHKVAVNDLGLAIMQNQDGSLEVENWKIATTEQQATDQTTAKEPVAEPVKIKLGEFTLDTTRLVEFTDLSVTPNMHIGLNKLHFNISKLDTDKPKQKSPIVLNAKTIRHGTIDIKGYTMPFDSKPSFDATGRVAGLDLRVASPKAEQAIGHIIKSGQLNADIKLLSKEGQLDSNIALVLHHFNLKAKSKEDAAALDETFGMPINQSLMLLKDKKDRIKLNIPITGDINNPEFDPTNAIIKATTKATTLTLITFYTPYGLAYAGGNVLFDVATSMNFDPVIFTAGSAQLTDAHNVQLAKLAELLVERPGVHLTLCGFTNLDDREKMFTEIIDRKKIKPPSAERLQTLKKLGSDRQENVKDHLVSVGKISHDRLILCEPEHNDSAESIGGVEISI